MHMHVYHVHRTTLTHLLCGPCGRYTYNYCMTSYLVSTGVCEAGCTPTEGMLATSEAPLLNLTAGSRWGERAVATKRPATSICSA